MSAASMIISAQQPISKQSEKREETRDERREKTEAAVVVAGRILGSQIQTMKPPGMGATPHVTSEPIMATFSCSTSPSGLPWHHNGQG